MPLQNYYAPQIFKNLGMTGTETSLFATGVYGVVKFIGCALFLIFCADSLGRRRSLLFSSVSLTICMFIIGIYGRVEPPVAGKPVSPTSTAKTLAYNADIFRFPHSVMLPLFASISGQRKEPL